MFPKDTLSLQSRSRLGLDHSTDKEYIVVDLTDIVRDFCNHVDNRVESLSYDIEGILREYSAYKHVPNDSSLINKLMKVFIDKDYVHIHEDAPIIARAAIDILYKQITEHIQDLGYILGAMHDPRVRLNPINHQIRCNAIVMVI